MIRPGRSSDLGHLLCAIPVIPLHQDDFLCDNRTLFDCTETNHITQPGVGFLISVSDAHSASDRDIEPNKRALGVNDSNETQVISKDVHVVRRRYRNGYFELYLRYQLRSCIENHLISLFEEGRTLRRVARSPSKPHQQQASCLTKFRGMLSSGEASVR